MTITRCAQHFQRTWGERKKEREREREKETRRKKEIREQPKNPHKPYKPTAWLLSIRRITGYPRLLLNARSNGKSSARENCSLLCDACNCSPTFYQFERTPALNQTRCSFPNITFIINRWMAIHSYVGNSEDEGRCRKARKGEDEFYPPSIPRGRVRLKTVAISSSWNTTRTGIRRFLPCRVARHDLSVKRALDNHLYCLSIRSSIICRDSGENGGPF